MPPNVFGLQIQFENPTRVFKPGDTVIGWIQVPSSGGKIHRVSIRWFGEAVVDVPAFQAGAVQQSQGPYFGQQRRSQAETETKHVYFEREQVLFDIDDSNDDRPGYEFDFEFTLPNDLPSSYEGEFGRVRYICTAKVDRGEHREGHVDHFGKQVGSPGDVNECKFFIDNPVDIKAFDEESVNMLLDADLGQRWCKPGLVIMHLYIAKQVYRRGEVIIIDLNIDNQSNKLLPGPEAILQQIVTYTGERQNQRKLEFVVAQTEESPVPPETHRNLPLELQIPSTAAPTLNNCKYIDVHYQLFVHCGGNRLEMLCPIVIG